MQIEDTMKDSKLHDITHWGIRASIGAIFIPHLVKKILRFLQ